MFDFGGVAGRDEPVCPPPIPLVLAPLVAPSLGTQSIDLVTDV
jgi:hypothetical protein